MRGLVVLCALAACGRLGFDLHGDGGLTGDGARDGSGGSGGAIDGALTSMVQYAGVFVTRHPGPGNTDTFSATAHAAGDLIAIQLGCGASTTLPSSVSMTATGWQFQPLNTLSLGAGLATEQLVAIAPDTNSVTITVTWVGSTCNIGTSVLSDEFSGADTAAAPIGAEFAGTGNCSVTFTTLAPAETIWAACFSQSAISGVGPGYTAGAANGGGDAAEYRITTDPPNTSENPTFMNSSNYVIDAIELKSR